MKKTKFSKSKSVDDFKVKPITRSMAKKQKNEKEAPKLKTASKRKTSTDAPPKKRKVESKSTTTK